jgi:hypothetical protein
MLKQRDLLHDSFYASSRWPHSIRYADLSVSQAFGGSLALVVKLGMSDSFRNFIQNDERSPRPLP